MSRGSEPRDLIERGRPVPVVLVGESLLWFMVLALRCVGLQALQALDERGVPALAPLPGLAPVDDELVDLGLHPGRGHALFGSPVEDLFGGSPGRRDQGCFRSVAAPTFARAHTVVLRQRFIDGSMTVLITVRGV